MFNKNKSKNFLFLINYFLIKCSKNKSAKKLKYLIFEYLKYKENISDIIKLDLLRTNKFNCVSLL